MKTNYDINHFDIQLDQLFTTAEAELSQNGNTATLLIKQPGRFRLNFDQAFFENSNIERFIVDAKSSVILFSQGVANFRMMSIIGCSFAIELEFRLKSKYLKLNLTETFYNGGYFEVENLEVAATDNFINAKEGQFRVEKAQLKVRNFIDKGTSYINHIKINSESINIYGAFSVLSGYLETQKSINIHEGALVQYFDKLILFSKREDLFINGTIRRSDYFSTDKCNDDELDLSAFNIHLAAKSRIDSCKKIKLKAVQCLKSDCGSIITKNDSISGKGATIIFDGQCQSKVQIYLKSEKSCLTGEKSDLECPIIHFDGNVLSLRGRMYGKVEFLRNVQQLYLAKTSVIQNCSRLFVIANFVESYGKIQSQDLDIRAYQQLLTNEYTQYESENAQFYSPYCHLQGKFSIENFIARGDFIKTNEIVLHTKNLANFYAKEIHLYKSLSGNRNSLYLQADEILNEAQMAAFSDVQMLTTIYLINMLGSAIESLTLTCQAPTLIQNGKITTSQRATLLATNDWYLGPNAQIKSPETIGISKNNMQIAGEVEAGHMAFFQANNILRFLPSSHIRALDQAQFIANKIVGKPNIEMKKGFLSAKTDIRLFQGLIKALDEVAFIGPTINTKVDLQGGKIRFSPGKNIEKSQLYIGENASIACDYLDSTHDCIYVAAKIHKIKELVLQNTNTVSIATSAEIHNANKVSIKTHEASIAGYMDGGNKLNPSKFILEAEKSHFPRSSHLDFDKFHIQVEDGDFDGSIEAGDYTLIRKTVVYKGHASIRIRRQSALINEADTPKNDKGERPIKEQQERISTNEFNLGSCFFANHLLITHSLSLKNRGILQPRHIQWDIQTIHNELTGHIGSKKSSINILSERFIHTGILEAEKADIKCDHYFLQNGGVIRATQFNLLSSFYLNFLGRTQAQQASFTHYAALRLALEEITFGYGNTFFTFRMLPIIPYFDGFGKIAEDLAKGNINIWDPNYLQYITPLSMRILRGFSPLLANFASIGLNSWYLSNAISQIEKFNYEEWSGKAVDLLPPLMAAKNALISFSYLVQDDISLCEKLGIAIPEWLFDIASTLIKARNISFDLFEDLWILIQKLADEISDFFIPIKSDKKDPQYSEEEQKAMDDINKKLKDKDYKISEQDRKDLESLKKKIEDHHYSELSKNDHAKVVATINEVEEHDKAKQQKEQHENEENERKNAEAKKELSQYNPSVLSQIEHVFEEWILPTALLLVPRYSEDAVAFAQFLGPNLTGVRTERTLLLSFSLFSPTLAVYSNRQTFGLIYCPDAQYAYAGNFTGREVHLGGNSLLKNLSVSAKNFYLREGDTILCVNAVLDVENLEPQNVLAVNYFLKWVKVLDEKDLLELKGRWSQFHWLGMQSIFYETNHPLAFQQSFAADYSYTYKSPQVTVEKDVVLSSKKTVGLISTHVSLKNEGNLQGETVIEESGDKIEQTLGSIESDKLIMHARNGINFNRSNIACKIIFISCDFGDINNIGSYVKAGIFMSVDAKRGNVLGQCLEKHIKTNGGPDIKYENCVFEGGTGFGFDLVGLAVHAGNKVINDGDFIAIGNCYIVGDFGVVGLEHHNAYIYKNKEHINWNLSYHHEVVIALRVKRPGFKSKEGIVFISSPWGKVDIACGNFEAKKTWIYSYEEACFSEIEGKTVTLKEVSFLDFGSKSIESVKELFSWKIRSPKEIGVIVAHGNVILPDITLDTEHLVTMPLRGNTYLINHKVAHELTQVFANFAVHLGPLQFSHSANPNDPHPNKVAFKFGPLDQAKAVANAKSKGELAAHLINLAITSKEDLQACISVGVALGSTETHSYYETPGSHYLRIGRWDDYSKEIYILGFVNGAIQQLRLHRGTHLVIEGPLLDFWQSSQNNTVNLSYNLLAHTVSASEQLTHSTAVGQNTALAQFIIHELFCRKAVLVTLNNAKLLVHHLQGKIPDVFLHTDHQNYSQYSFSTALSSDGNASFHWHAQKGHKVKEVAEFQLDDIDDGQVINIHADGGKVSGKAFEKMPPNLVEQKPIHSWTKNKGFGISFGLNSHKVNTVSFERSNVGYTESIQITEGGLIFKRKDFYHGMQMELNIPYALIPRLEHLFRQAWSLDPGKYTSQAQPKPTRAKINSKVAENYFTPHKGAPQLSVAKQNHKLIPQNTPQLIEKPNTAKTDKTEILLIPYTAPEHFTGFFKIAGTDPLNEEEDLNLATPIRLGGEAWARYGRSHLYGERLAKFGLGLLFLDNIYPHPTSHPIAHGLIDVGVTVSMSEVGHYFIGHWAIPVEILAFEGNLISQEQLNQAAQMRLNYCSNGTYQCVNASEAYSQLQALRWLGHRYGQVEGWLIDELAKSYDTFSHVMTQLTAPERLQQISTIALNNEKHAANATHIGEAMAFRHLANQNWEAYARQSAFNATINSLASLGEYLSRNTVNSIQVIGNFVGTISRARFFAQPQPPETKDEKTSVTPPHNF